MSGTSVNISYLLRVSFLFRYYDTHVVEFPLYVNDASPETPGSDLHAKELLNNSNYRFNESNSLTENNSILNHIPLNESVVVMDRSLVR